MEYSISSFDVDTAGKTFSTEASELESFSLKAFKIVSALNNVAEFVCADTLRDDDGDVQAWILRPTNAALNANANLAGWKVVVYND